MYERRAFPCLWEMPFLYAVNIFCLQMFIIMNPQPLVQSGSIVFLNAFENHFVFFKVVVTVILASGNSANVTVPS